MWFFLGAILLAAALPLARCEEAFLPGVEPEDIMNVQLSGDDVSDGRGMAEIIRGAGTNGNFQLDMRLDKFQEAFFYNASVHRAFAGAGMLDRYYRWPKNIIPYKISSAFSSNSFILSAMKEWMDRTCIVFKPANAATFREVGHNYAATIISKDGCWSLVGFQHGRFGGNQISLQKGGCDYHETALHELGHAIGLHHEQCRMDRDNHINIFWDHIEGDNKYNFKKQEDTDPKAFGVAYDYCSIMHYEGNAFSSDGGITMITKDQDYQYTIGNLKFLSFTDAKVVNLMYNCNSHCGPAGWCKSPCYVNHKCTCECPNPCVKRPCADYPPKNVQKDKNYCSRARSSGSCKGRYRSWYTKVCGRSCGVCDEIRAQLGK